MERVRLRQLWSITFDQQKEFHITDEHLHRCNEEDFLKIQPWKKSISTVFKPSADKSSENLVTNEGYREIVRLRNVASGLEKEAGAADVLFGNAPTQEQKRQKRKRLQSIQDQEAADGTGTVEVMLRDVKVILLKARASNDPVIVKMDAAMLQAIYDMTSQADAVPKREYNKSGQFSKTRHYAVCETKG